MDVLDGTKHFFLVGITGVGVTAIAQILKHRGHEVSGSDTGETFFTNAVLEREGIPVRSGFREENITDDIDVVVHSTAYGPNTPDLLEAKRRGLPIFSYPDMLGMLFERSEGVSIAGSHGKTTTTSFAGVVLAEAGFDPTVVVGSSVVDFNGNARMGSGKLFVVETDEYQNKFTKYSPLHLLVTNIDYDHPDFFSSEHEYVQAFKAFIEKLPHDGVLVMNGDDPVSMSVLQKSARHAVTFGKTAGVDVRLLSCSWKEQHQDVTIDAFGERLAFALPLPGEYNALNAAAAIALTFKLGARKEHLTALSSFSGLARRFHIRLEHNGAPIIDDYAHHPSEIRAAISGARQRWPDRHVIAVFQPHTFSRTRAFLKEFAAALSTADQVVLLDIYGSVREKDRGGVTCADIRSAMKNPEQAACVAGVEETAEQLKPLLTKDHVVLLLGAGNVWETAELLQ